MPKITNWTAKRAGATITVKGTNEDGLGVTITGITQIDRPNTEQPVVATRKDGTQFNLA